MGLCLKKKLKKKNLCSLRTEFYEGKNDQAAKLNLSRDTKASLSVHSPLLPETLIPS